MNMIKDVIDFLKDRQLSLTAAESCTGGLLASKVTAISGSGSIFDRGYVVYSAKAKNEALGVSFGTIEKFGLSSEEVASEMALGALRNSHTDVAVANTGLAESDGEGAGMVCFACALLIDGEEKVITETVRFEGDRNAVREAAARHALMQIPSYLERLGRG